MIYYVSGYLDYISNISQRQKKNNQFPKMIIVTFEPKHIAINLVFLLQSSISPDVLYMIPPLGLY